MKKVIIPAGQSGKRVDRFLAKEVFCNGEMSRVEISREVKEGKILVNGKKVRPSHILKENDVISLGQLMSKETSNVIAPNPKLKIKIIEDNKNFLVIDKPAGIQVHPDAHKKNNTVVNWLIAKYPEVKKIHDGSRDAELRPGIVHRLDRETSGVMVVAKNQKTFDTLKKLFQTRKVKKSYLALVYGILEKKEGVIEKALARSNDYKKQTIATDKTKTMVRPAVTAYRVQKEMADYSLVEVSPKTGRTHQIRIHLWSIGHPVVGDTLYKRRNNIDLPEAVKRQLLHAEKLSFNIGGKTHFFEAKMPKDMQDFLKGLKGESKAQL